ncbi:MAG TPA: Ig-like domain-containing protein [Pyrinomonadaceae bacterium]|nr:Ig-like domain-containing protein [Pyrinomonadaceae bacterium]
MNYRTSFLGRRYVRGYVAIIVSYVMLVGQVAPLALAAGGPAARPAPLKAVGADTAQTQVPKAAPAAAPLAAPAVGGIMATKTDNLSTGVNPGDQINYEVVVSNSGSAATGVQFSDTIDTNTTLVPGTLTASPLARNDSYTTDVDTPLTVPEGTGVRANDFGLPTPSVAGVTVGGVPCSDATAPFDCATANGTLSLAADGSFTYTPASGFSGSDAFDYTAANGNSPNDTATVTITVTPPDAPPVGADDASTVNEDSSDNAIDVLANDTDGGDGGDKFIASASDPANGSVTLTGGTAGAHTGVNYTPDANYCGSDSFTYNLTPGTSTATVNVTVTCVDDLAVANDDAATVAEDSGATAIDVLANDDDVENDAITITGASDPANGTVVPTGPMGAHTGLTYQPDANYCGSDSFTYTVNGGDTATVNVTVTCVEDAATANDDTATVPEDSAATTIAVLANDNDPDGDAITITEASDPANGTVALTGPSGAHTGLTYQPDANYCNTQVGGTPDTFTYTVNGGDTATVSVTVTCEDDLPVANDDTPSVAEDSGATALNVLSNDSDGGDGGPMTITTASDPAHGTVVLTGGTPGNHTGLTYQPDADYFGSDSFTYELNGGDTATVSVTVTEVNDAPSAANDALLAVNEDAPTFSIPFSSLLGNDNAGPSNENTQTINITGVSAGAGGTPAINGSNVEFTLAPNFCGSGMSGASFTYTVTDNGTTNGSSDPKSANGTVTFDVNCVNDAPSFTPGANVSVAEDSGAYSAGWATAISPGPGESGQTVSFGVTNDNTSLFTAGAGQPAITSTGTLTFTPAPNAFGVATVTVILSDNGGTANGGDNAADAVQFTITVTAVNDAPVADADGWDFVGNTVLEVDAADDFTPEPTVYVNDTVLTGDSDPVENNPISVTGVVGCAATPAPFVCATVNGGSVTIQSDGRFVYTPKAGDTAATDSFQYVLTDAPPMGEGNPASVNATVTLTREGRVWYVNNQAAPGGDGTSATPFNTLAAADTAANASGDTIYVFRGDGTTTGYNTNVSLTSSQRLIGQGVALTVPFSVNGGSNPHTLLAAGSQPLITNSTGNAVTVSDATGVEIRGLSISSATNNAIEVNSTAANNAGVTIANNSVTGAGQQGVEVNAGGSGGTTVDVQNNTLAAVGNAFDAASTAGALTVVFSNNSGITSSTASGVVIDGSGGGTTTIAGFTDNTVAGTTAVNGISITSALFDSTPGGNYNQLNAGTTAIGDSGNAVGGGGLVLTNVRGNLAFNNLDVYAGSGAALFASSTAAYNGTNAGLLVALPPSVGTFSASAGPALNASLVRLDLQSIAVTSGNNATGGILLNDTDSSTVTVATGSTITNGSAGATAFDLNNSTGTYTYNGTITTTAGKGVELTNNGGATVSFTNDLILSSGTAATFAATGGGTVTATDTDSTLTSTTGVTLDVQNTTIGAGGLKFKSITAGTAASGPPNAIVLNNTGASGGLSVLGGGNTTQGGNDSGGIIQRTTGDAISLTSTASPSFNNLKIDTAGGHGIKGTSSVSNFSFTYGTINNVGDASDESCASFSTVNVVNATGTFTFTNSRCTLVEANGVDIKNYGGNLSDVNVSNNVFSDTADVATPGSAVLLVSDATTSTSGVVTKASLNNNTITNFRAGAGFVVQASAPEAGTATVTFGTANHATNVITISGNLFDGGNGGINNQPDRFITGLIKGRGTGAYVVTNNGTAMNPIRNIDGVGIELGGDGPPTVSVILDNNHMVVNNAVGSAGIAIGCDEDNLAATPNNGVVTTKITNNNVSDTDGPGIFVIARGDGSQCTMNANISNNTVAAPTTNQVPRPGIQVHSGSAGSDTTLCLDIQDNTTAGSTNVNTGSKSPGIGIRKEGSVQTTNEFGIEGLAPSPATGDQAATYVYSQNPNSATGINFTPANTGATSQSGSNYQSCSSAPNAPLTFTSSAIFPTQEQETLLAQGSAQAARSKAAMSAATGQTQLRMQIAPPHYPAIDEPDPALNRSRSSVTTTAPAVRQAPVTAAPSAAPAAAPARVWSDIPVIINRTPRSDSAKDEDSEKDDEDSEKKDEEKAKDEAQTWGEAEAAPKDSEATPQETEAAPKKVKKSAKPARTKQRTDDRPEKRTDDQHENRNISYLGPLGSAPAREMRFARASYEAGDIAVTPRRNAPAKTAPKAAPARAAAPLFSGETVNVNIGDMPGGGTKSVTIRFSVTVNNSPSVAQVSNQGSVTYNESGTPVLTDDLDAGGASDPTVTPVNNQIRVSDAKVAEPGSGSINMVFTVTLSRPVPAMGTVSVNFTTAPDSGGANPATAGTDYTTTNGTVTFSAGEQVKTINVPVLSDGPSPAETDETFLVTLSGPSAGSAIADGQGVGTITQGSAPGAILISELRTSGPLGPNDDFVELYNNTDAEIDISGYGLFKTGADCSAPPALLAAIPGAPGSGTTKLKARGHYLLAGSAYSLKDYGGTDAAKEDQLFSTALEADANVGLFPTSDPTAITSVNRLDAVGFAANVNGTCDLLREPSNLPGAAGSTTEHTYFRKLCDFAGGVCSTAGNPKDTGNNSADFTFANTDASVVAANPQKLGAPGPENLSSPVRMDNKGLVVELLDRAVASAAVPNRTRMLAAGDPVTEPFGSMTIRRRVVNNTGSDVTRLRFRIIEFTTKQTVPGVADLRALTGTSESSVGPVHDSVTCFDSTGSATTPCNVNVSHTTLEQPPAQSTEGGGLNSTLSAGTISLGNKLLKGKSINLSFKLGVHTTGTFRFLIIVEALP